MLRRLEVTEQISEHLKDTFSGAHIYDLEVHEIKVDENDVDITLDLFVSKGLNVTANLQVGLDDDTELSVLLREGVAEKLAKKKWFELDPHGSQDYNVKQLNRYLAAHGVRLVQGHEVGGAGSAALKLCIEQLPTEEE